MRDAREFRHEGEPLQAFIRRLMRRMNACWDAGGFVRVGTATRYTDIKPKSREVIVMCPRGSVFMKRGKRLECLDFCHFQFSE